MDNFTLQNYIDNPTGSIGLLTKRDLDNVRVMYKTRLAALILRENNLLYYKIYKIEDDVFLYHIKIPSETIENFFYDVILKFTRSDASVSNRLETYNLRMFSNDPHFNFTYANLFIKEDLIVNELKSKVMKEAKKKEASIRNPDGNIGYIKTIVFSYYYLYERGLLNKLRINPSAIKLDKGEYKKLLDMIPDSDKVLDDRVRLEKEGKVRERVSDKDKINYHQIKDDQRNNSLKSKIVNKVSKIGKVGKIKSNSKIKKK